MRTSVEFRCPRCRGSHFGRGGGIIGCHDAYERGCTWKGDDTPETIWRVFVEVRTFDSREEYVRARAEEV